MELESLLPELQVEELVGDLKKKVENLTFDSRKPNKNGLFIAVAGTMADGHQYIAQAIRQGATAVIMERMPEELELGVTYIKVNDSAAALGKVTAAFFDRPSAKLSLVGVTGTNGKTTTVTLLHQLFMDLGYKAGLISTIENRVNNKRYDATHTTPDPVALNELLDEMVQEGCQYVFMEVSSHAVVQKRITGLTFAGGIFTNISHDHLDYHGSFKAYIDAKKGFFDDLDKKAFALVNVDDKRGSVMVQNTQATIYSYGLRSVSDFKGRVLENSLLGLHLQVNETAIYTRLIGEFNAYNLLAVYGAALCLGQKEEEVLRCMSNLRSAQGRFDYLYDEKKMVLAIVDYAHTPDALEKVLSTIHDLRQFNGRIITVVGCGGDRDKTKRPVMGRIAAEWSDWVVVTSDNPRSENPATIIADMLQDLPESLALKILSNVDRKQAITTAYRLAKANDILLIAGKGHEKYQEIEGVKYPFDDKEIVHSLITLG